MNLNRFKISREWSAILVLCVAMLAAYCNSFRGEFIFDDRGSIHENESLRKLSTAFFPQGNSGNTVSGRPVLNFTLAVNYLLHGLNVTGYHVASLMIHMLAVLALYGLVRRTFLLPAMREKFGQDSWWLALVVAMLWGLHPLQTESVTYIVQRAESLVGLFYWLTLYCFVRATEEPARVRWQVAAVASCLLGMGSKEVMAGAPLVALLFDRTFISGSFLTAWRARKRFYIALCATWILLAVCIIWTGKRGSTVGYNEFASWWRYGITQCFAIIHYLKLVFWPSPLVLDYGKTLACDFNDAALQTYLVALLAGGTLWALWKQPKLGFPCALFFIVLAPSSSVVPVLTQTLAEHRMYLAVAPVVALFVYLVHRYAGRRALWIGCLVAVIFGVLTFRRNDEYRTEENIWRTVTERCPLNQRGWGALSSIYYQKGDLKKAKQVAAQGLKYMPKDTDALGGYAHVLSMLKETVEAEQVYRYALDLQPTHYQLNCGYGTLLLDQGKPSEAKTMFERALIERPDGVEAHYELGKALVELGSNEDAVVEFNRAIALDPKSFTARNNLGNVLINLNRQEEAIKVLKEAQALAPDSDDVGRTLGLALISLNRIDEAIVQLEKLLKRTPWDVKAQANLGLAYAMQGKSQEACTHYEAALKGEKDLKADMVRGIRVSVAAEWIKLGQPEHALSHYQKAVEIDPNDVGLRYLLANLLLQLGDTASAIPLYEQIIKEQPADADAHNELGVAYLQTGRTREARKQFEATLEIQPNHSGAQENLRKLESFAR